MLAFVYMICFVIIGVHIQQQRSDTEAFGRIDTTFNGIGIDHRVHQDSINKVLEGRHRIEFRLDKK